MPDAIARAALRCCFLIGCLFGRSVCAFPIPWVRCVYVDICIERSMYVDVYVGTYHLHLHLYGDTYVDKDVDRDMFVNLCLLLFVLDCVQRCDA